MEGVEVVSGEAQKKGEVSEKWVADPKADNPETILKKVLRGEQ